MRILLHALVVAAVFVGTDMVLNGGTETSKLFRKAQATASLEVYQARASIHRAANQAHPRLAIAELRR